MESADSDLQARCERVDTGSRHENASKYKLGASVPIPIDRRREAISGLKRAVSARASIARRIEETTRLVRLRPGLKRTPGGDSVRSTGVGKGGSAPPLPRYVFLRRTTIFCDLALLMVAVGAGERFLSHAPSSHYRVVAYESERRGRGGAFCAAARSLPPLDRLVRLRVSPDPRRSRHTAGTALPASGACLLRDAF